MTLLGIGQKHQEIRTSYRKKEEIDARGNKPVGVTVAEIFQCVSREGKELVTSRLLLIYFVVLANDPPLPSLGMTS